MTPNISTIEMRMIADLLTNPGYKLLLEAVLSEIDFAADTLDKSGTYDADIRNKAFWKALRRIYVILRDMPQELHHELEEQQKKVPTSTEEFMAHGQDSYGRYLQHINAHYASLINQAPDAIPVE